jgi:two-component system sensor histidine kinase KdpD
MNEFQRQFLRSVSHNLQTPITTISLVADDLADPTADPTPSYRERQIRVVRTQARRLEHLVAQLITVSRLDAGRLHLERDVVAIEPLVRRVWAALDSERALAFSDEAPDRIVVGDRDALEQILWILFDNAVRYAPTGRVGVTIAADDVGGMAEADGGPVRPPRIRIDVADEGPGIPESEQRNIFRRFWSGSAGRGQGGTGIGLDIARRLSRAMGGSLRYEPGRPNGAVFVLTLPAELARPD